MSRRRGEKQPDQASQIELSSESRKIKIKWSEKTFNFFFFFFFGSKNDVIDSPVWPPRCCCVLLSCYRPPINLWIILQTIETETETKRLTSEIVILRQLYRGESTVVLEFFFLARLSRSLALAGRKNFRAREWNCFSKKIYVFLSSFNR